MIVKIQRAIVPADGPMLVYNKSRKFTAEMASTPEIVGLLEGDLKGYFDCELVGSELRIGERVAERNW